MSEENKNPTGGKELALSSIIGAIASIIAASISALAQFGLSNIDISINVHWTMWIAIGIVIYSTGCYVIESNYNENKLLRRVFKVPLWSDLRVFGEQPAAKASYWALIIIPIIAYV